MTSTIADTHSDDWTNEQIEAAARSDPDNPLLTPERLASMKPVPRVKSLRRALRLTQEEFAERYRIPVGTLRDWEQGRTEPDAPARAYLLAIAGDADGVMRALNHRPGQPAES
jgi:putative transcriptional regulator